MRSSQQSSQKGGQDADPQARAPTGATDHHRPDPPPAGRGALRTAEAEAPAARSPEETERLLHELRVHQIELELQNEELRRTQLELELSRARYFALYDLAPVGYVTLSEEGLIREGNLTLATLLGTPRASLAGQPLSRFIASESQDHYYLHWKRLWKTGAPQSDEVRLERPGPPRWVQLDSTVADDTVSEARLCRATLSDISARRQAEAALRETQARRLADAQQQMARLQQLNAQEQAARARVEEASRLKDEFLATVSHELRTPLTTFLGYAQLLQRRPGDVAYVTRTVARMVASARVQAALIEDLLDVARIANGKLRLTSAPIALTDVIHAALDTVRPTVEAKGLVLQVDLDPAASAVVGDAKRLQQVVWNLLANAAKFTPPGGRITVRLVSVGSTAELRVSDTGQGIRAEFLPDVFERFRQADSSSQRYGKDSRQTGHAAVSRTQHPIGQPSSAPLAGG